jgi:hypothetical protein
VYGLSTWRLTTPDDLTLFGSIRSVMGCGLKWRFNFNMMQKVEVA